jgi:predicted metal-dependent enzyme (double-stranded beta helix superfamily)
MVKAIAHPIQPRPRAVDMLLHQGHIQTLDRLAKLPPAQALRQAITLVARLAREGIGALVTDLSDSDPRDRAGGPVVARHVTGRAGAWWLGFYLWLPGAATAIHDHTSWGVYYCAAGTLQEERYRRLDDGAQPNHARLKLSWRRHWSSGDISELLPYEGGIHRVTNPGDTPAWSAHLYGPRLGPYDGRDYDPAHDAVCDRAE